MNPLNYTKRNIEYLVLFENFFPKVLILMLSKNTDSLSLASLGKNNIYKKSLCKHSKKDRKFYESVTQSHRTIISSAGSH